MRASALALTAALVVLGAGRAAAYPWMIRHQYANCSACHVDPSGAGLLTPYGLAQQELLVTAHYGKSEDEVNPPPGLLFGAVALPSWLNAGFSFRGAVLDSWMPQAQFAMPILMVSDLRAEASAGPVHALATLGFDPVGARLAALTNRDSDNLISREHWIGLDLLDKSVMLRAGRVEMPFGLRNVEHVAWVRSETRTDLNSAQQYGVAAAYNREGFRAEVLGIAGNFLIRQPEYREHGYSGYAELAPLPNLTAGVSSLVTQAALGLYTSEPDTWRQAHGLFARWSPVEPLVILGEADLLVQRSQRTPAWVGSATFAQADYEPFQGLHFMLTGETLREDGSNSLGGWVSVDYYFFSYCELRLDNIFRENGTPQGSFPSVTVVGQLHLSM